jgi:hypothetical protein
MRLRTILCLVALAPPVLACFAGGYPTSYGVVRLRQQRTSLDVLQSAWRYASASSACPTAGMWATDLGAGDFLVSGCDEHRIIHCVPMDDGTTACGERTARVPSAPLAVAQGATNGDVPITTVVTRTPGAPMATVISVSARPLADSTTLDAGNVQAELVPSSAQ